MNIYNENCLDTMKNRIADNTIDLTVTSPPYDDIRTYTDNIDTSWGEHIWKPIISELYRITKPAGKTTLDVFVEDALIPEMQQQQKENDLEFRKNVLLKKLATVLLPSEYKLLKNTTLPMELP